MKSHTMAAHLFLSPNKSYRLASGRCMMLLLTVLVLASGVGTPAQGENPSVAVHPSRKLNPEGQLVTVIGKGVPSDITVQLAQCTGLPLKCQALVNVEANKHGMFITRVLVAFDFSVLNPFPQTPTCSEPTSTGETCLLFATPTSGSTGAAYEPITFSELVSARTMWAGQTANTQH